MKKLAISIICICLLIVFPACDSNKAVVQAKTNNSPQKPSLSPINWGKGELGTYLKMDNRKFPDNPIAVGKKGAVSTTYHAAASRAGLEALNQGGSSVDAAMATALTQITLNAGAVISFFGIMNMLHYDAGSGKMYSLDATWNTVQNETDPMSIPGLQLGNAIEMFKDRKVSGRTALVGGFLKGLEAAHNRFGKLPFQSIFEPAIYLAENGFELSEATAAFFKQRDKQIRRLAETKATLTQPDGKAYLAGDFFKQPALAATLRKIAAEGADYMYKGAWAKKAVAAIQRDGGKMELSDLESYEIIWNDPIKVEFGEYEVAVLGPPAIGSVNLIEALNLAYAAGIPKMEHWSKNGESLRRLSDITNMFTLSFLPQMTRKMIYPDLDLSDSSRLKKETAEALWEKMEQGIRIAPYADPKPKHSDTVVAIDQWGNMTAVTHSINCVVWGNEAIVVDGISIGDPASFQQAQIAAAGPGNRLPGPIELGILSKNGTPILPFASMATGLHQQTVQSLLNIIAFDMNVEEAVEAPCIFLPFIDASNPMQPKYTVRVMEGTFPAAVLEESKLPVMELPASERRYTQGLWIGIYKDPITGRLEAASPPYATGRALAY